MMPPRHFCAWSRSNQQTMYRKIRHHEFKVPQMGDAHEIRGSNMFDEPSVKEPTKLMTIGYEHT